MEAISGSQIRQNHRHSVNVLFEHNLIQYSNIKQRVATSFIAEVYNVLMIRSDIHLSNADDHCKFVGKRVHKQ